MALLYSDSLKAEPSSTTKKVNKCRGYDGLVLLLCCPSAVVLLSDGCTASHKVLVFLALYGVGTSVFEQSTYRAQSTAAGALQGKNIA